MTGLYFKMFVSAILIVIYYCNLIFNNVLNFFSSLRSNNKPIVISVEGNIASGKSTFIKFFEIYCQVNNITCEVILEPINLWNNVENCGINLLKLYYKNPKEYSFIFQTYVYSTLIDQVKSLSNCCKEIVVIERSIFSAQHIFV